MKTGLMPAVFVAVSLVLSGCASDDPNQRAKTGAAIGAVTGAVLGHQVSHGSGKWVGAAVGALAGAGIGHYMDNQQRAFEETLAYEREQNQMEIERMRDDTLKLSLDSEVSFDFDSARIKPTFEPSLEKLADLLIKYDRSVVHVVGHTDSRGSSEYNLRLSKERADSVAQFLEREGVPYQRLRTEGRGEYEPRDTNATEAGRQLNRRVEVYVKPVVEGRESDAYLPPKY